MGVNNNGLKHLSDPRDPNNDAGQLTQQAMAQLAATYAQQNKTHKANNNQTPDGLIDYNDEFKKANAIMFRDAIIREIYAVLLAKKKPNVLLVGPAGGGKTALAEEIGRQLANQDPQIPIALRQMKIYELPLSGIVAGTGVVGELETKMQDIIAFAEDNPVVLFIDEIHLLMNSSQNPTYDKIAQILKPALARGKMRVIGATTTQEARNFLRDPAFSRRFSEITVDELTQEQEQTLLANALPTLTKHYQYQVQVNPTLLKDVVTISDEILRPHTHRPDSGLTLLDRVMGEAVTKKQALIAELTKTGKTQQAQTVQNSGPTTINLQLLQRTATKIVSGLQTQPHLTRDNLTKALAPVTGQDNAKKQVIDLLLANNLGIFAPEKPLSILLVGSSGVGKTMLSRLVARYVTNTEPIVLNMAEYSSSMTLTRILGSSAGYVGSDSHAELPFDILDSNPYQVILLDEFDQADVAVQRLFMRVFDEGKLQLANNHVIDFSKAIIFVTTNGNNTNKGEHAVGFNQSNQDDAQIQLKDVFEDKVLNRFSAIIAFKQLSRTDFITIMKQNYHALAKKLQYKVPNLPAQLSPDELAALADRFYRPEFGARPAQKALEAYIQTKI